jgi:hypothetical protein
VRWHPFELRVAYSLLKLFGHTGKRLIDRHPGIHQSVEDEKRDRERSVIFRTPRKVTHLRTKIAVAEHFSSAFDLVPSWATAARSLECGLCALHTISVGTHRARNRLGRDALGGELERALLQRCSRQCASTGSRDRGQDLLRNMSGQHLLQPHGRIASRRLR